MDLTNAADTVISAIKRTVDYYWKSVRPNFQNSSLTELTRLTRAEPLTIISKDCYNLEYLNDVLLTLCNIYSGYFLQAVAILTKVQNVEVVKLLDKLSPNRSNVGVLLAASNQKSKTGSLIGENYRYALPTAQTMAMEADVPMVDQTNYKVFYETNHLAFGKLLNVSITVDSDDPSCKEKTTTINIPVSVRLAPGIVDTDSLVRIFGHQSLNTDIVERYYSWRAGRITLIKDMIFCQDLINEYRRTAMKDQTGTLQEIVRRVTAARTYGVMSQNPSLAVSSNLYVISKAAAAAIEAKTGYRFSKPAERAKRFHDTYAMVVAVIDPEWEQISFYFNGIAAPSTMKISALKSSSKKGVDVSDIMRSLLQGQAPTF